MDTTPSYHWVPISLSGFVTLCINIYILKREIRTRNSQTILFVSKSLKLCPILSMISSIIFAFFTFTRYFDTFCHISWPLLLFGINSQGTCMGFYQLSRLYYCFSQSKAHSNNGYPSSLFVCFFVFGVILMINSLLYPWILGGNFLKCGINKEFESYRTGLLMGFDAAFWMSCSAGAFLIWDWCTLLLYGCKARALQKFQSENADIYLRVQSILVRILILTLFYEIFTLLGILEWLLWGSIPWYLADILYNVCWLLISIFVNISMLLMQQHNSKEYSTFLRFIYGTKLYFICCGCCCKAAIEHDIRDFDSLAKEIQVQQETKIETISYETHDLSEDHAKITVRGRALSPDTVTVVR